MFNKNNTGTLPRKVFEAKKAKSQKKTNTREASEYDDEVDTCMLFNSILNIQPFF
jgi:hypothetical protein